ncbi:hypothetical protein L7F22_044977 [Adiantum nelumboides]|nr:hypothetical protein [Adiantum nelumboides]
METPVHLSETMQSPKPMPNAQEQVAETPVFQAVPVQPTTFQQPIVGSNGQGSNLQAMEQVFPPPSVHPRYFGGGSVFQSMADHAPGNQFYTLGTVSMGAQTMMPNPLYGSIGMQPGFQSTQSQFGMPQANFGMAGISNKQPYVASPGQNTSGKGTQMNLNSVPMFQSLPYDNLTPLEKPTPHKEGGKGDIHDLYWPGHIAPNCPQRKRPADSEDKEDRKGKKPMAGLVTDMVPKPTLSPQNWLRNWESDLKRWDIPYTAEAGLACPGHTEAVTPIIGKLRLHIWSYVDAEFYIMPLDGCDVLLGIPWMFRVQGIMDAYNKKIIVQSRGTAHILDCLQLDRVLALSYYEEVTKKAQIKANECVKDKGIEKGDLLLRYNSKLDNTFQKKFQIKWEGPFTVVNKFDNGTYQLADLGGAEHKYRVNGYRLKKYFAPLMTMVTEDMLLMEEESVKVIELWHLFTLETSACHE